MTLRQRLKYVRAGSLASAGILFKSSSGHLLSPVSKVGLGANQNKGLVSEDIFWNVCFDKGRLKNFVSWFLQMYGEYKTIQLVEQLKNVGFQYATKAGISLGIEDLKIPPRKATLILEAEKLAKVTITQYNRGEISGVERFQRLIDTWHRTSERLKQEVIDNFEATDILNPVYMMAFSGARGNISQVRQLVGMRGLMADPQGQIIDFPIRSNFREGLTLTEYIISSYGARKGIVDTALRTANAGYLTRRLVDVAQHVVVSQHDCGTNRGLFLTEMKEGNKIIYSLQNRLIGRVLAKDIYKTTPYPTDTAVEGVEGGFHDQKIASRNQEVSNDLAFTISKNCTKVFVRSSLTCETKKLVCQLCYGWSLAQGSLVSIGEAVGIVAAQSIGEPGTQLTMRTFHTGGVFSGDVSEQIRAPYDGYVQYSSSIAGTLIRTAEGQIAFLIKNEAMLFVLKAFYPYRRYTSKPVDTALVNTKEIRKYKIPAYTVLFIRNNENVFEKQVIAQISSISRQKNIRDDAELTIKAEMEGQFYSKTLSLQKKLVGPKLKDPTEKDLQTILDPVLEARDWSFAWILSGKIYELPMPTSFFPQQGDFLNTSSTINQTRWLLAPHGGIVSYLYVSNFELNKKRKIAPQSTIQELLEEGKPFLALRAKLKSSKNSATLKKNPLVGINIRRAHPSFIKKPVFFLNIKKIQYHNMGYVLDVPSFLPMVANVIKCKFAPPLTPKVKKHDFIFTAHSLQPKDTTQNYQNFKDNEYSWRQRTDFVSTQSHKSLSPSISAAGESKSALFSQEFGENIIKHKSNYNGSMSSNNKQNALSLSSTNWNPSKCKFIQWLPQNSSTTTAGLFIFESLPSATPGMGGTLKTLHQKPMSILSPGSSYPWCKLKTKPIFMKWFKLSRNLGWLPLVEKNWLNLSDCKPTFVREQHNQATGFVSKTHTARVVFYVGKLLSNFESPAHYSGLHNQDHTKSRVGLEAQLKSHKGVFLQNPTNKAGFFYMPQPCYKLKNKGGQGRGTLTQTLNFHIHKNHYNSMRSYFFCVTTSHFGDPEFDRTLYLNSRKLASYQKFTNLSLTYPNLHPSTLVPESASVGATNPPKKLFTLAPTLLSYLKKRPGFFGITSEVIWHKPKWIGSIVPPATQSITYWKKWNSPLQNLLVQTLFQTSSLFVKLHPTFFYLKNKVQVLNLLYNLPLAQSRGAGTTSSPYLYTTCNQRLCSFLENKMKKIGSFSYFEKVGEVRGVATKLKSSNFLPKSGQKLKQHNSLSRKLTMVNSDLTFKKGWVYQPTNMSDALKYDKKVVLAGQLLFDNITFDRLPSSAIYIECVYLEQKKTPHNLLSGFLWNKTISPNPSSALQCENSQALPKVLVIPPTSSEGYGRGTIANSPTGGVLLPPKGFIQRGKALLWIKNAKPRFGCSISSLSESGQCTRSFVTNYPNPSTVPGTFVIIFRNIQQYNLSQPLDQKLNVQDLLLTSLQSIKIKPCLKLFSGKIVNSKSKSKQFFINKKLNSLAIQNLYSSSVFNKQLKTTEIIASLPNIDFHIEQNLLWEDLRLQKSSHSLSLSSPPSSSSSSEHKSASAVLIHSMGWPEQSCLPLIHAKSKRTYDFAWSYRPLNFNSFVVGYKNLNFLRLSSDADDKTLAGVSPPQRSNQYPLLPKVGVAHVLFNYKKQAPFNVAFYKTSIKNTPNWQCFSTLLKNLIKIGFLTNQHHKGAIRKVASCQKKFNLTKLRLQKHTSIESIIPILFDSPCLDLNIKTTLLVNKNGFFASNCTESSADRSKKKQLCKTKFYVNLGNNLISSTAVAQTSFFSAFEGELLNFSQPKSKRNSLLQNVKTKDARSALKFGFDHFTLNVGKPPVLSEIEKPVNNDFVMEDKQIHANSCLMLTKKDLVSFSTIITPLSDSDSERIEKEKKDESKILSLGQFYLHGDLLDSDKTTGFNISGQIVHLSTVGRRQYYTGDFCLQNLAPTYPWRLRGVLKRLTTRGGTVIDKAQDTKLTTIITLRRAQPIFISPKGVLHVQEGSFVQNKAPVITLAYQRLKTGDIIEGIPKVEQFFEARTTKRGRLFKDSLPNLLRGLFGRYRKQNLKSSAPKEKEKIKRGPRQLKAMHKMLSLNEAVRQSFYKIQQIIVDGVQRVYRSQGAAIADKHLEVIVRQMTSKVQIVKSGQTAFYPGELVDFEFIAHLNSMLFIKMKYAPVVVGITRASLQGNSFLAAASFQQTTKVLSKAAVIKQQDFLKGLKQNVMLGNLIPAGTGYLVTLDV